MPDPIFISSRAALDEAISEAVDRHLRRLLPAVVRRGLRSEYLTKKDLKRITGWSDRTISYKQSRREIPYVKRGRTVLYPTEEIFAYLDEGYIPAKDGNGEVDS